MKMRKRLSFVLKIFLTAFSLTFCLLALHAFQEKETTQPFPPIESENVDLSPDTLKKFTDQIETWQAEEKIVGAVLMVIKSRKTVLHEAYGWRDREEKLPMEKDTICRLRSMTKPFVGTSILLLSEGGKLDIKDEVAKHVPFFRNDKCREITIEHLLSHTGGFTQPGYPLGAGFYPDLMSLVKQIGISGPKYKPGERYFYSDAGSSTLAYTVSIVSGIPVEDFIQTQILDKLGMVDTFCNLTLDDPRRPRVSCTYSQSRGNWNKYWDNSQPQVVRYFRGSGGMYSTTEDYARFLAMWMDKGQADTIRLLKPENVEKALEPSPLSRSGDAGYGYQWEIYRESEGIFGHRGSDGTLAIAAPKDDLIFLYFTQSRGNQTTGQMLSLFFEVFYPDTN
jgi:CubicO group peptidase (beta-lactamase class C family)